MDKKLILNIPFVISNKNNILQLLLRKTKGIKQSLHSQYLHESAMVVFTPNPEQVVYASKHSWFHSLLAEADILLPDGMGIVWAMNFLYHKKIDRIAGVDFMQELIKETSSLSVAFLGGKSGAAESVLQKMHQRYSGVTGWTQELPLFLVRNDKLCIDGDSSKGEQLNGLMNQLVTKIENSKTQMIFVGLGAPKQELFIKLLSHRLDVGRQKKQMILMAVGGSFEIIAGMTARAPLLIRQIGLEWFWRLLLEPWRIKRQLALVTFIFLVIKEKFFPSPLSSNSI